MRESKMKKRIYYNQVRRKFASLIKRMYTVDEHKELRTAVDDLLIAYDQATDEQDTRKITLKKSDYQLFFEYLTGIKEDLLISDVEATYKGFEVYFTVSISLSAVQMKELKQYIKNNK